VAAIVGTTTEGSGMSLVLLVVWVALFGFLGTKIYKNRPRQGLVLGLFLGPLGLYIAWTWQSRDAREAKGPDDPTSDKWRKRLGG
jgi:hypothetical protein